jgi:hypothetical protein
MDPPACRRIWRCGGGQRATTATRRRRGAPLDPWVAVGLPWTAVDQIRETAPWEGWSPPPLPPRAHRIWPRMERKRRSAWRGGPPCASLPPAVDLGSNAASKEGGPPLGDRPHHRRHHVRRRVASPAVTSPTRAAGVKPRGHGGRERRGREASSADERRGREPPPRGEGGMRAAPTRGEGGVR